MEVSAIDFTAGASAFTISVDPNQTLTISGAGVSNDSGIGQNFETFDRNGTGAGAIVFMNSATAGVGNTYTNNGRSNGLSGVPSTQFFGTSNAGSSIIINNSPRASLSVGGFTQFLDQSSAANSMIINAAVTSGSILDSVGSATIFNDNSTAGNATLVAQGSNAVGDDVTEIDFLDQSTADHATITIEGGGSKLYATSGFIIFEDTATAGNASVTLLGAAAGGKCARVRAVPRLGHGGQGHLSPPRRKGCRPLSEFLQYQVRRGGGVYRQRQRRPRYRRP